MNRIICWLQVLVILFSATFFTPVLHVTADSMSFTEKDMVADENYFTNVVNLTIGRGSEGVNSYAAQAFVPTVDTLTGCRLHMRVGDTATITIQVRTALDGGNESILYSGNYPLVANPHNKIAWWEFDFNRAIKVTKGQTYYLVFWCDIYHSQCIISSTQYVVSNLQNISYQKQETQSEWTPLNRRSYGFQLLSDPNVEVVGFPYRQNDTTLMIHHAEEVYGFYRCGENTTLSLTDQHASQGYFSIKAQGGAPDQNGAILTAYVDFDSPFDFGSYRYFYTDLFVSETIAEPLQLTYSLLNRDETEGLTCTVDLNNYTKGWHRLVIERSNMQVVGNGTITNPSHVKLCVTGQTLSNDLYFCFDNLQASVDRLATINEQYYTEEELADVTVDVSGIDYIGKPTEAVTLTYGDINDDTKSDANDALMVLRYIVGKEKFDGRLYKTADVSGDNLVNANDALQILRYTVGKIQNFDAEQQPQKDLQIEEVDFHLSATGLQENTIYVITTETIGKNTVYMPHDAARLISSLQGLVNREIETNRVALLIQDKHTSNWLGYIKENDTLLNGMDHTVSLTTVDQLLSVFANQLKECGMTLWDPNVSSTANVAATICGLNGYLPVKYDTAKGSLYQKLCEMGVPVRLNLVDKFSGKGVIPGTLLLSSGSKKCDPYLWALEKVSARCSDYYTVYLPDGASATEGNIVYENDIHSKSLDYNKLFNHDYGIYRKAFFFDLTPIDVEAPCDDPTQKLGTDRNTLKEILLNRYCRARGTFGEVVGFPPWALKYATHNGWGSIEATSLEASFTELITMYNCYLDADGSLPNCSLYTQFALQESYESIANQKPVTEVFDENTVYLYMYTGDYDSSPWAVEHMYRCYNDPTRGSIPITWSFTPGLCNRIPMVIDYLYRNQTENDYFSASDSGVGYVRPHGLFQSESDRTLPDGDKAFIALNKQYFERFDLDSVGFLIGKLSPQVCHTYNQFAPIGSNGNDTSWSPTVYNGAPYLRIKNGIGDPATTPEAMETAVSGMLDFARDMKEYHVAGFRTIKFTAGDLKRTQEAFLEYAKEHDPDTTYKFVDYKTYFAMMKEAGIGYYTLNG